MSQAVQIFNFDESQVRTVMKDGEPWFVAKDVAKILGYARTADAVRNHCKHGIAVGVCESPTPLDSQTVIIPERDIYRLVMRSKLPAAERFEEWVVGEVLPAIRKTGRYEVSSVPAIPANFAEALKLAYEQQLLIEEKGRLIEEMAPKAEFYDQVAGSSTAIDIGTAAKVLNLEMGRTKLFSFLRENKVLMENNLPYQGYIDNRCFRVIEQSYGKPDGSRHVSFKTVVYQEGLMMIRRLLLNAGITGKPGTFEVQHVKNSLGNYLAEREERLKKRSGRG